MTDESARRTPTLATARRAAADRGRARGAPVRRRAAARRARDRGARRRRSGDRRRSARRPRGDAAASAASASSSPGDRVELATAPEAGALIARYVGADAVRLSPAALETLAIVAYRQPVTQVGDRADPRRRLRLHDPGAAPSPARRRARPLRRARPADPVRHRLRVPRAVRPDEPRRPAAARRRRRRAAGRGGRRRRAEERDRPRRRADRSRTRLMPPERLQKVLAAAGVARRRAQRGAHRGGPGHGRRPAGDDRPAGRRRAGASSRSTACRSASAARTPTSLLHKPAGVTSTTRDRHAATTVLDLLPTALVPDGARLYPVGRLDQDSEGLLLLTNDGEWAERVLHPRFGVEREYAVGLRASRSTATSGRRSRPASRSTRASPRCSTSGPTTDVETRRLVELLEPSPRRARTGIGRPCARDGSASSAGCSPPSVPRSTGSSASGSAPSGSMASGVAGPGRSRRRRSAGLGSGAGRSRDVAPQPRPRR